MLFSKFALSALAFFAVSSAALVDRMPVPGGDVVIIIIIIIRPQLNRGIRSQLNGGTVSVPLNANECYPLDTVLSTAGVAPEEFTGIKPAGADTGSFVLFRGSDCSGGMTSDFTAAKSIYTYV
ncbi:hypothetical protein C8R44DRAFT_981429 [Mycena epipterygia]|nr:hypothetical protein C8R44DRAFT_981429 [Mycena epipterygia]